MFLRSEYFGLDDEWLLQQREPSGYSRGRYHLLFGLVRDNASVQLRKPGLYPIPARAFYRTDHLFFLTATPSLPDG